MPGAMTIIAIGAATLFLSSLTLLLALPSLTSAPSAPLQATPAAPADPLAQRAELAGVVVPPFELADPSGAPVTPDVFSGRVTILGPVFSNCPFICPLMTAEMLSLAKTLGDTGVRFVVMSLDPAHDTPQAMGLWAERLGARSDAWTFATEPPPPPGGAYAQTVRAIVKALGFDAWEDAGTPIPLQDGSAMLNIAHPPYLFLIGPRGELLDFFDHKHADLMAALAQRARAADAALAARTSPQGTRSGALP
ncbi:MAG: hypothetical protein C0475_00500 [Planctomyces sp.]|nr:hypothetical protein [Planctomyces sp.]MBA4040189.1 hypothetical protein [Planctomyces sp.]MBA4119377.1 hypothetical protein [Isosphaera sp.]